MKLLLLLLVLIVSSQALYCQSGSWVMRTATVQSPITQNINCSGVCQLTAGTNSDLVQTASCVTQAQCDANTLAAFPTGSNFAAVTCCTTDNCNDPTEAIYSCTLKKSNTFSPFSPFFKILLVVIPKQHLQHVLWIWTVVGAKQQILALLEPHKVHQLEVVQIGFIHGTLIVI